MDQVFEWFRQQTLAKRWQIFLAAALALAVVGYSLSTTNSSQPQQASVFEPLQFESAIFVHVVGEVAKPGLYELAIGAKAADAIDAAGGLTKNAQPESVNLARPLSDGEQLVVLSVSDQAAGTGKISVNRATASELDELPGIGPALSERIIQHREEVGGFRTIEELTEGSGIGTKLYAKIRDKLTL